MTTLQLINASSSPEVQMNENFETLSAAGIFGKRHPATTGLTWGYYGGRYNGNTVADGAVTLSASATNYVVVNRTTGVVSVSTNNTNWNDDAYARLYQISTGSATVSSVIDSRFDTSGLLNGGGGGGGGLSPINDQEVLANTSGGSATPVGTTVSALLDDVFSSARGSLLTRGASAWVSLAPGTSGYVLTSAGSGADLAWSSAGGGGGGLTNWTESYTNSGVNNGVAVASFVPSNSFTHIDAVLSPKGVGGLLAQVPDGTTTGGDKRGQGAVDWQASRTSADQVASGTRSSIAGGSNNKASGNFSFAVGTDNLASTSAASAIGQANTASGFAAHAQGYGSQATANYSYASGSSCTASGLAARAVGNSSTADADYSQSSGYGGRTRGVVASVARGGYPLSSSGDNQQREVGLHVQTTNAITTRLVSDQSASSSTNQIGLPVRFAATFHILVTAHHVSSNDTAGWILSGVIKRTTGGTMSLVGTPTVTALGADSGAATWSVAVSADDTLKVLAIDVTGEAAKTIVWAAGVYWNEVGL